MSNMCFEVSFLAGTDIREALREAKEKAEKFGVSYIKFSFNSTKFSVSRKADLNEMLNKFHEKEHDYIVG